MKIGEFQAFSLNEYPGEISSVIFTQGCNFNCRYCFNPELIPHDSPGVDCAEILEELNKRKDDLTAVTVTGGEPLLQDDIVVLLSSIRMMGYKIKLNTNGSYYTRLKNVIDGGLVDYIRMDVKASPDKYEDITCCPVSIYDIEKSIKLIKKSGIDHEFHTVMDEDILDKKDVEKIRRWIKDDKNYKLGEKK